MNKLPVEVEPGLPVDFLIFTKSNMVLTLKSTIYEKLDDTSIKALMPIYNGKLMPLEKETRLIVVYNLKEVGRFEFEAVVSNRSVEGNTHLLLLDVVSPTKKSQRRNYFRVPFFESLTLMRLSKELPEEIQKKLLSEHQKKVEKYKDRKDIIVEDPPLLFETIQIECRDISGGGMRGLARKEVQIFELLEGALHVDDLYVEFKGEVIRISPSYDSVYPYELGIKFTEMDESMRTKLIGYVFRKQRNLMKKG